MNQKKLLLIIVATFACAVQGAAPPILSQQTLTPAVEDYLQKKGDFCLGKFNWPIVVTDRDRAARTNDAIQMPILEKLGLVASSIASSDPTVKTYDLTENGRKFYVVKKTVTLGPLDKPIDHPGDLCVANLKLDRIVGWQPVEMVDGRSQTMVNYTYKIASSADWAQDPQITMAFPMIDRIIRGEGKLQLMQSFAWIHDAWVAVIPGG